MTPFLSKRLLINLAVLAPAALAAMAVSGALGLVVERVAYHDTAAILRQMTASTDAE